MNDRDSSAPQSAIQPSPLSGGRLTLAISLGLFCVSLWLLSLRMYVPSEWGDEGYFVNAAMRILSGEVIYRDFQHNYAPGRMYVLAVLIKTLGQDLGVVRIFWILCHALTVAVGFCVARRLMPLVLALGVAIAILFNSVHQNKAVELLVSAVVLLVLFRVLERRTGDLAAGLAIGFLAYFRHDVAVMACVVFALLTLLQAHRGIEGTPYVDRLRSRWSSAWKFPVAFALMGLPYVVYLLQEGAFSAALDDLVFSGLDANLALSKPFPTLFESWWPSDIGDGLTSTAVIYYAPPLVYLVSAGYAVRVLIRREGWDFAAMLLCCAVFGSFLFLQVLPRTDIGHLSKAYMPVHILSFALIAVAASAAMSSARKAKWGSATLCILLTILAAAIPVKQIVEHGNSRSALGRVIQVELLGTRRPYIQTELPFGRYKWSNPIKADWMRRITAEILKHEDKRETETMVVYPAGAIFNFLYGYRNPLRYDVLRPGEIGGNDQATIHQLVKQLVRARPRVMMHVKEGTNRQLATVFNAFARAERYKFHAGSRVDVWIRSDP